MVEIVVKNNEKETQYVAGVAIPPGESKILDSSHMPGLVANAPATAKKPEPIEQTVPDLLGNSVPKVLEGLKGLSDKQLDEIEALENAEENSRVGVLNGIAAERLARADAIIKDPDA